MRLEKIITSTFQMPRPSPMLHFVTRRVTDANCVHSQCARGLLLLCTRVRAIAVSLRACLRCSVGSVFSESSARDSLWMGETEKTRPSESR